MLKDLEPEEELKTKIDAYRTKRARNTAIGVALYILSVIFVIGFGGISELVNSSNEELFGVIGVICMFTCIAAATGLIIYTHMSMPQDVGQYIHESRRSIRLYGDSKTIRFLAAFMKVYWMIILIVYLTVSFATGLWGWTWLIWLIASAVKEAVFIFFGTDQEEINSYKRK